MFSKKAHVTGVERFGGGVVVAVEAGERRGQVGGAVSPHPRSCGPSPKLLSVRGGGARKAEAENFPFSPCLLT